MRAGRMWVLLVLAALFSMHGLQFMAVESSHESMGFAHVQTLTAPEGAASTVLPVVASAHLGGAVSMAGVGSVPAGHDSPVPGVSYAWASCLAVVVTGLTVLGALVVLRKVTASKGWVPTPRRSGSWTSRSHPVRPPDLAVLCLLRI